MVLNVLNPEESKSEEGMGLEASELARWTRFAAKGGIGKCTATCDCIAESTDDLMFLKVVLFAQLFFLGRLMAYMYGFRMTRLRFYCNFLTRKTSFWYAFSVLFDVYVVEYWVRATARVSLAISQVLTYIFMPS